MTDTTALAVDAQDRPGADDRPEDFLLTGMTCAACASRIERRLNKVDGISATVNYATERATVVRDPAVGGWSWRSRPRWSCGRRGRCTGRRSSTPATARPRWTR